MKRLKPKQPKAPWFISKYGTDIKGRPWKKVKPESVRRQTERQEYNRRGKKFLAANPHCGVCVKERNPLPPRAATQVHHRRGRKGSNYLNEATWLAICQQCHDRVHREPAWAKENGYLGSFIAK
jgi:hypothetical protein